MLIDMGKYAESLIDRAAKNARVPCNFATILRCAHAIAIGKSTDTRINEHDFRIDASSSCNYTHDEA